MISSIEPIGDEEIIAKTVPRVIPIEEWARITRMTQRNTLILAIAVMALLIGVIPVLMPSTGIFALAFTFLLLVGGLMYGLLYLQSFQPYRSPKPTIYSSEITMIFTDVAVYRYSSTGFQARVPYSILARFRRLSDFLLLMLSNGFAYHVSRKDFATDEEWHVLLSELTKRGLVSDQDQQALTA